MYTRNGAHSSILRIVTQAGSIHEAVFDRLQYANTAGESLGDLATCGAIM